MTGKRAPKATLFLLGTLEVGGSEKKIVSLARRLRQKGLPVHVAYLRPPATLLAELDGVPTVHLQQNGKLSFGAWRNLVAYVREHNIQNIVTVNFYPLIYALPLKWRLGSANISVIASINTSEFQGGREKAIRFLYIRLLRRVNQVIFGAQNQQELWHREYLHNDVPSAVILNGVDSQRFDPAAECTAVSRADFGIGSSDRVLVTVAKLRPEKGHDRLFRAIESIGRDDLVKVHLFVVGDGEQKERLSSLARSLGIQNEVHFVGTVEDVRPYLRLADLFLLTSIAVETFSNSALEAASMGLPVVISDVGGAREMFPDGSGAIIYDRDSEEDLVSAIKRQLDRLPISDEFAAMIRSKIVDRFSTSKMDEAWSHAIWSTDELAESGRPGANF